MPTNLSKFSILLLILGIVSCFSEEQDTTLQQAEFDKNLARYSLNLASKTFYYENQKILDLFPEAISPVPTIEHYTSYGKFLSHHEQPDKAIEAFETALDIASKNDLAFNIEHYIALTKLYAAKGMYLDIQPLLTQLEGDTHIEPKTKQLVSLQIKENTALSSRKLEDALRYNSKRLSILNGREKGADIFNALAMRSELLYYLGETQASFQLRDSLLSIRGNIPARELQIIYGDYGVAQFYEANYQKADSLYHKALEVLHKNKQASYYTNDLATAYANIAEVKLIQDAFEQSRAYLDSFALLNPAKVQNRLQKSVLNYELSLMNATNSDVNRIQNQLNRITEWQDKAYEEKTRSELQSLQIANTYSENLRLANLQIAVDKQRAIYMSLLLAFLLIFLSLAFFAYQKYRQKIHEQEAILMQQRLLTSQMNPHFTFNTLFAVQRAMVKDQQLAKKYLTKFSRLLRKVLENSVHNYVSVDDELVALEEYLQLQQLRFPELFDYDVELKNFTREDHIMIPPMLVQPFVENSIEHGFQGLDYKGFLHIELSKPIGKSQAFLDCYIKDNGTGLQEKQSTDKNSLSLKLISDFIKKSTKSAPVITNNSPEGKGVIVKFKIPFKS